MLLRLQQIFRSGTLQHMVEILCGIRLKVALGRATNSYHFGCDLKKLREKMCKKRSIVRFVENLLML